MTLTIKNISYAYTDEKGQKNQVIKGLNLDVHQGEFVTIIGKSGTGKSTIFKCITGLLQPYEGEVLINNKKVSLGDVGYMPQKDLLLPWRTILENIMLASEIKKEVTITKEDARMWLERVGLQEYENAYPNQLSGGMRQRVSFLRTFLTGKDVLLLDEPFGALDALTKKEMQSWLLSVWQDLDKTVLFITHDLEEAVYVSDRIVILHQDQTIEDIPVELPRPRHPDMVFTKEMVTLRQELEKKIANEKNEKMATYV